MPQLYIYVTLSEVSKNTGVRHACMYGLVKRETGANPVRSRRCNMGVRYQMSLETGRRYQDADHRARRPAYIYVHHNHEELVEYMTASICLFLLTILLHMRRDILLQFLLTRRKTKMNETMNKRSNKKIVIAGVIIAALIAIFAGVYFLLAPKANAGAKDITLTVVDDAGAETVYDVNTDAEYLVEVFDEVEGLTVEGDDGDYGLYINTVNGVTADFNADGAYWSIYVNGEVGMNGANNQPVIDGNTYSLVYEVYDENAIE